MPIDSDGSLRQRFLNDITTLLEPHDVTAKGAEITVTLHDTGYYHGDAVDEDGVVLLKLATRYGFTPVDRSLTIDESHMTRAGGTTQTTVTETWTFA